MGIFHALTALHFCRTVQTTSIVDYEENNKDTLGLCIISLLQKTCKNRNKEAVISDLCKIQAHWLSVVLLYSMPLTQNKNAMQPLE